MNIRRVDPARSRIVLVGVPAYTDASILDVPNIANNITDLVDVLTDPALGGFAAEHVLVAPAGARAEQVGALLIRAAAEAEDLLLFYYAGHGFRAQRRADLYLSLAGTQDKLLEFSALPFDAVRGAFLDSGARSRAVILDTCYSGTVIGTPLGEDAVLEQLDVAGTYTLTASPATRPAMAALPGEQHTAFTGRLLHVLQTGNPDGGPDLSLGEIYRHLLRRLRADGLPEPQQRGTANGDLLALTPNPGYKPPTPPVIRPATLPEDLRAGLESRFVKIRAAAVSELATWLTDPDAGKVLAAQLALQETVDTDRPEVADLARRVLQPEAVQLAPELSGRPAQTRDERHRSVTALETAERLVRSITDESLRAYTLADVASVAAPDNPARASRLFDAAERIARGIADEKWRSQALADVAKAAAASDTDRAVALARDIPDESWKARTLAHVAKVTAVTDAELAALLFDEAETVARIISEKQRMAWAMTEIAKIATTSDPNRTARLLNRVVALDLTNDSWRQGVLTDVAKAATSSDPDLAETIAQDISDKTEKVRVLAGIARSTAADDRERAVRLLDEAVTAARDIADGPWKVEALADIAEAAARSDPDLVARLADEAEAITRSFTDKILMESALTEIAKMVVAGDPDRAETIAHSITSKELRDIVLSDVAFVVAASDPERAKAIAHGFTDELREGMVLADIALAVVTNDPVWAEAMANNIRSRMWKALALTEVAKAVVANDPERTSQLLGEAEKTADQIAGEPDKARTMARIAKAWLRLAS